MPLPSEPLPAARRSQQRRCPRQGRPGADPGPRQREHHHRGPQPAPEKRASPGAAAPGPAWAERPGSCREQPTRALLADAVREPAAPATAITSSIVWTAARRGGLNTRLAGPARDTGTLSRINRSTKGDILLGTRAACQVPEDKMTEKSERLPRPLPHHTRRSQERLERSLVCRVIQDSCRTCPYPPQTLELLPVSQTDVP